MKLKEAIFILIVSCISFGSFAQNDNTATHDLNVVIPEVALLGVVSESQTDVSLNATMPTKAGDAVNFSDANNSRIWINYSSIISEATPKRKVIAMVQGEIPQGVKLVVEASDYSGSGKGKLGKPAGEVVLSNQPSDVIVDIGSCYTGKGVNNGHYLTYKLEKDNSSESYAMLNQQNTSVNVVYTLTDYN